MPDIKNIKVDGVLYDIKDDTARKNIGDMTGLGHSDLVTAITALAAQGSGDCSIPYVESTTDNMVYIRNLESGTYVFYGKFKPFAGSTSTLTFSSKLLVNVIKQSSASHVMVFYPVNNCVQYLKVTDDAYERKNVYLNELADGIDTLEVSVGDLSNLATEKKTDLVSAINEVASSSSKQKIVTMTQEEYEALVDAGTVSPTTIYMIVRDAT